MIRWISILVAPVLLLGVLACDSGGGGGATPGEDTVVPGQDTVAPGEDTVVPGEDTAAPGEDTVAPGEDILAADTPEGIDVTVDLPGEDTPSSEDTVDVATPDPPVLKSGHTGWKKAKCWNCHDADVHNDGLDPYLCADCHGTNGAPGGHSDSNNCGGCHGAEHGADGFPDPLSCKTCHPS